MMLLLVWIHCDEEMIAGKVKSFIKANTNLITEIGEGFGERREAAEPRQGPSSAAGDGRAVAHGAVAEAPPPPEAPRHHLLPLAQVAAHQGRKAEGLSASRPKNTVLLSARPVVFFTCGGARRSRCDAFTANILICGDRAGKSKE